MNNLTLADISKFLTEEVIDKAFKLKTNSHDTVKSIEVTRAAPIGEGLLSAVLRIHVTGLQHSTSFVVKGLVKDPVLRRSLNPAKFFEREAHFFSKILPLLCEVQASLGAKERIQNNIPICYSCHQDGYNDYILLEDLSEANCSSLCETPSEDEKNVVLKILAHLHAVSMALRIKRPEEFTKIGGSLSEVYYTEENRDWYSKYLSNAIDIDRKVIAELENPDSVYFKKFEDMLSKDLYGQFILSVSTWGDHPVFCHGDTWSPNFLISHDRAVAIDFQLARCASPAIDLAYWIIFCTNHRTVKQNFLDAAETYYSAIKYYLKDMTLDASKVFPRETLDQELQSYGKYGLLACLTSFPLLAADKCDLLNSMEERFPGLEKVPLESIWPLTPIQNKKHKLRLLNAIRIAVDVGII